MIQFINKKPGDLRFYINKNEYYAVDTGMDGEEKLKGFTIIKENIVVRIIKRIIGYKNIVRFKMTFDIPKPKN